MATDDNLKVSVKCLLRQGRAGAQTGKELAKVLGFSDDRSVRLAIRELIADGMPVASAVDPPYGFFIAKSVDEADKYMRSLRRRLIEDAVRRRDFKLAAREIIQPGQLELF